MIFEVQAPQFNEEGKEFTQLVGYKEGTVDPERGSIDAKSIIIKFDRKNPVSVGID